MYHMTHKRALFDGIAEFYQCLQTEVCSFSTLIVIENEVISMTKVLLTYMEHIGMSCFQS